MGKFMVLHVLKELGIFLLKNIDVYLLVKAG